MSFSFFFPRTENDKEGNTYIPRRRQDLESVVKTIMFDLKYIELPKSANNLNRLNEQISPIKDNKSDTKIREKRNDLVEKRSKQMLEFWTDIKLNTNPFWIAAFNIVSDLSPKNDNITKLSRLKEHFRNFVGYRHG